jgi:enoyl-CoA hydratase
VTLVLRHDTDGVATLTLNRPEKLNALTRPMMIELRAHIEDLATEPAVGCVRLMGAGRCFSAGHDLAETGRTDEGGQRHFDAETVDLLEQLPQPTVAAVHSYCLTGALEVVLACDLIVATESAQFGDTHAMFGLVPIWGMSVRMPERVGRARALDLAFTARRIDGREALTMGLADRCVPDAALDASTAELAAQIVANSWGANAMLKQLYRDESVMSRPRALAYERTRPYGLPGDHAGLRDRRASRTGAD